MKNKRRFLVIRGAISQKTFTPKTVYLYRSYIYRSTRQVPILVLLISQEYLNGQYVSVQSGTVYRNLFSCSRHHLFRRPPPVMGRCLVYIARSKRSMWSTSRVFPLNGCCTSLPTPTTAAPGMYSKYMLLSFQK